MRWRMFALRALVLAAMSWGSVHARAQGRETTLDELLRYAERHSPRIETARARLEEGTAARRGASPLLSDPLSLSVAAGPRMQDDGQGDYDVLLAISQPIEIAGERGARMEAADRLMDEREAELEAVRWEVHRDIHLAYHHALHDRARVASEDRWIALAEEVLRIATARASVGEAPEIDRVISAAELARARQRRLVAAADYQIAILTLAEISGWNPLNPPIPAGQLDRPHDLPDDARLIQIALANQPTMRAAAARVAAARAALAREERNAFPSLGVGVQLSREGSAGSPANFIGLFVLSVALPVWQQNTAARANAEAALVVAEAERDALRTAIEARVMRAASTVRLSGERLRIFERDVLPGFEASLAGLAHAYEIGEIDLATLTSARQTLLSVQVDALDAYTTYHDALAELEAELGSEIDLQEREASPTGDAR